MSEENANLDKNSHPGTLELHSCPFLEEIHDNTEDLCNCCDECSHECFLDT